MKKKGRPVTIYNGDLDHCATVYAAPHNPLPTKPTARKARYSERFALGELIYAL